MYTKIFIPLFGVSLFSFCLSSYANEIKTFTTKTGYALYKHNVTNFCKEYKNTDSSSELIYTLDEGSYFREIQEKNSDPIAQARKEYETNMDEIYACATNISFKRQIDLIKNELITKSPKLNAKMRRRLDNKLQVLKKQANSLKGNCKINTNEHNSIIKKSVLKQTTYELCKYNFYLGYLQSYINNSIGKFIEKKGVESASIEYVTNQYSQYQMQIQAEIQKSYRVFPLVFQAYSDFENNIGTHLLLELLREDYNTFREELHKTINPINQVVYKISNAMKK